MADPNDIPRSVKLTQAIWPIVLAALVGGASIVSAAGQVKEVERRVNDMEANGPAVTRERLARIEAKQDAVAAAVVRMENKLDGIDPSRRRRYPDGL